MRMDNTQQPSEKELVRELCQVKTAGLRTLCGIEALRSTHNLTKRP